MANENYICSYFENTFGLIFGQVKKYGWYVNCTSSFGGNSSYRTDVYIGITGGAVFRCAKPFYTYVGAGGCFDRGGIFMSAEAGFMFHFKHFSFKTGVVGLDGEFGIQFGLGYNF